MHDLTVVCDDGLARNLVYQVHGDLLIVVHVEQKVREIVGVHQAAVERQRARQIDDSAAVEKR